MPIHKIEPIDVEQCQTLHREGSFMSFGPPTSKRCQELPEWIAVEVSPSSTDGQVGAMSLCDGCKDEFLRQFGDDYAHLFRVTGVMLGRQT